MEDFWSMLVQVHVAKSTVCLPEYTTVTQGLHFVGARLKRAVLYQHQTWLISTYHVLEYSPFEFRFSTDEGQCWAVYNFTDDPIYFSGLASEPGARSMNLSLWGYRDSLLSQYWVSITIDFKDLLTRTCE